MSVDIIIPTKGNTSMLFECIDSIIKHTTGVEYHVYIADTGSTKQEIQQIVSYLHEKFHRTKNISLLRYDYYNFAAINNDVVLNHTTGKYILFCNNDIVLQSNCINRMYQHHTQNKNVGTVGCRLIYPDNTVQHAGQIMWLDNKQLNVQHRGNTTKNRYNNGEVIGNTAALAMIDRNTFMENDMFNIMCKECFEDVELNLKLLTRGYINYYFDDVVATHHESFTRSGNTDTVSNHEHDIRNVLNPFWNSLTNDKQRHMLQVSADSWIDYTEDFLKQTWGDMHKNVDRQKQKQEFIKSNFPELL